MSLEPDKPSEKKIEAQHSILQVAEHVLSVGLGAAGGMAVGAILGVVGGPPGMAVGAVTGAMAGGLGGEAFAELIDVAFDDQAWQEHSKRHGYSPADYEQYRSAYQMGCLARHRFGDQPFEEIEAQLRKEWESQQAAALLPWDQVQHAAHDAWSTAALPKPPSETDSLSH